MTICPNFFVSFRRHVPGSLVLFCCSCWPPFVLRELCSYISSLYFSVVVALVVYVNCRFDIRCFSFSSFIVSDVRVPVFMFLAARHFLSLCQSVASTLSYPVAIALFTFLVVLSMICLLLSILPTVDYSCRFSTATLQGKNPFFYMSPSLSKAAFPTFPHFRNLRSSDFY